MIANWRQQVMSKHVHDIALQAPADQLEQYLSAADEFRIPYWDWAQGTIIGPVPEFFITPTLTLTNIDGVSMPISNPLYSYRFRPIPDGFDDKVSLVSTTCKKNKKNEALLAADDIGSGGISTQRYGGPTRTMPQPNRRTNCSPLLLPANLPT